MKRIGSVGAAIAGLLIIGVAAAPASSIHPVSKSAAAKPKPTRSKFVTTRLTCSLNLDTQVPDGTNLVTQGAADGTQFGKANCGKPLGSGLDGNSFQSDDAGTQSGPYQLYFNSGTVYGKYSLTPADTQPPSTTTFTTADYAGTLTIRNGTGLYKKAKGTGTMSCSTTDSAHYTCTEKIKLILPRKA